MGKLLTRGILAVLWVVWLAPVYLLIVNATRSTKEYASASTWSLPQHFALWSNFKTAYDTAGLGGSLYSTALYAVVAPAIAVLIGALAGFAIIALRLRHGFLWFMVIFGGSIFPVQMLIIPLFVGYADANLYDHRTGLILIYTAVSVPLAAFIMRNFFSGVSYNIYEAAVMDGAPAWRIFTSVYMPLAKTACAAIFILEFTFIWNDLLFGLTLSQGDNVRPVMTALSSLLSAYAGTTYNVVLAAMLFVSLPTMAVFLCAQRLFARGLALGQTG
jgi:multiple sugar transport system permease protein